MKTSEINIPTGVTKLILDSKWGTDGSSGFSEYKQKFSDSKKVINTYFYCLWYHCD